MACSRNWRTDLKKDVSSVNSGFWRNDGVSDVNIRPAVAADLAILLEFEQGVVAAERPYNDELKAGTVHYYDIAALIASDESLVLVAEHNGLAVGTGHATIKRSLDYLFHDRHAYLGLMYVAPEHRGQGIIQKIITALIEWSREQGVTDYYLDVYADNEPALSAYEKFGFRKSLIEMRLHDSRD
jgi:GNAT superfamily N-acetyltransferase